jgi:hypothetical protein
MTNTRAKALQLCSLALLAALQCAGCGGEFPTDQTDQPEAEPGEAESALIACNICTKRYHVTKPNAMITTMGYPGRYYCGELNALAKSGIKQSSCWFAQAAAIQGDTCGCRHNNGNTSLRATPSRPKPPACNVCGGEYSSDLYTPGASTNMYVGVPNLGTRTCNQWFAEGRDQSSSGRFATESACRTVQNSVRPMCNCSGPSVPW